MTREEERRQKRRANDARRFLGSARGRHQTARARRRSARHRTLEEQLAVMRAGRRDFQQSPHTQGLRGAAGTLVGVVSNFAPSGRALDVSAAFPLEFPAPDPADVIPGRIDGVMLKVDRLVLNAERMAAGFVAAAIHGKQAEDIEKGGPL